MHRFLALSLCLISFGSNAAVEFHHWWTSKGERAALDVMYEHLQSNGIGIKNSPVTGGGGDSATTVLQARALAGNTPHFAQTEGPSIMAWDAIGILQPLNETAQQYQWNEQLYPMAIEINHSLNGYVALPLTLHRMNWLWTNQALLKHLGLTEPKSWPELIRAMEIARDAGIQPLVVGEQPWQIAQLFESLLIARQGVSFYQSAMVRLEPDAINSSQMHAALEDFRHLSDIVSAPLSDPDWDAATAELAAGNALFQIGGDWILGELNALGQSVPQQIGCTPVPGTRDVFLYNMDSFIFFYRPDFHKDELNKLAGLLAEPDFQRRFNLIKGSVPVRKDISMDEFSVCQQRAKQDFLAAQKNQLAVPSMTDSMAVNPIAQHAINNELFRFFRQKKITSQEVTDRIRSIAASN